MIWVLFTKASKSYYKDSKVETYLELLQFDSLIEAVNYGLKQYHRIIIHDQKQENSYNIYREYIEDFGFKFIEYDYHINIYDDYIE